MGRILIYNISAVCRVTLILGLFSSFLVEQLQPGFHTLVGTLGPGWDP